MIEEKVRAFITANFYIPNPADLSDAESLLDAGIIDSTGVLELIGFIESEFKVTVEDEEMVPENLDSIGNIVRFVTGKQAKAV